MNGKNWSVKPGLAKQEEPLFWLENIQSGAILPMNDQTMSSIEAGAWRFIDRPPVPGPATGGGKGVKNV